MSKTVVLFIKSYILSKIFCFVTKSNTVECNDTLWKESFQINYFQVGLLLKIVFLIRHWFPHNEYYTASDVVHGFYYIIYHRSLSTVHFITQNPQVSSGSSTVTLVFTIYFRNGNVATSNSITVTVLLWL